jgi:hypothetical protein
MRLAHPRAVVFFGISGAGKGTQADLLARHLTALDPTRGVLRVEQGALLRARASHNDELGRRVTAIITAGKLVPNFVATTVLAEHVSKHFSGMSHFVFDGVARSDLQARMFDELMIFFDRPAIDAGTRDSDLMPAVRMVRTEFPTKQNDLIAVCHSKQKISSDQVRSCLLPEKLRHGDGTVIIRPVEYRTVAPYRTARG